MKEFNELYQCTFEPTARDLELRNIAKSYHDECESYDRIVCTGWSNRDNCAMPVDSRELQLINNNATKVRLRLISQNLNFSSSEILKAISNHR